MPKAVGYVRVSTDKQLDNTSIEKQKEEIEKYCKNNQLTLVKIYDEGAYSAENIKDRKEFKKMYHHVFDKDEEIDYVIVFKSDRISRNNLESLYIYKSITDANKHLICIADNIDTRDRSAKVLYQIMALVSEFEKDTINFRTAVGLEKNFEKGNFNGGRVYGYNSVNKELQLNEKEAKVVRYIFEKYTYDQWGYKKIATNLNEQGIKTKNNKHWTTTAVKTILNNRIYIGDVKWRGRYQKGKHTRIIDDNLWNQTQKMLKIRSYLPKKVRPGSYPLSGLIKCPECGSPMVQGNSNPKYKYYQCSKNKNSGKVACSANLVKKEYAEKFVFDHLFKTFRTLNLKTPITNATLATLSSQVEPIEDRVKDLKKELIHLSNKKDKVIDWFTKGTLNDATFEQQIISIQKEEEELEEFISTLEKQLKQREIPNIDKQIGNAIDKIDVIFNILSVEDKKKILHAFIDEISVNQGNNTKERTIKEIKYKFDFKHLTYDQSA